MFCCTSRHKEFYEKLLKIQLLSAITLDHSGYMQKKPIRTFTIIASCMKVQYCLTLAYILSCLVFFWLRIKDCCYCVIFMMNIHFVEILFLFFHFYLVVVFVFTENQKRVALSNKWIPLVHRRIKWNRFLNILIPIPIPIIYNE